MKSKAYQNYLKQISIKISTAITDNDLSNYMSPDPDIVPDLTIKLQEHKSKDKANKKKKEDFFKPSVQDKILVPNDEMEEE